MRNKKIKRMVATALLMAMVIVLQFVSAALPTVGGFSFSLVLLPIVVGSAIYGPGTGALLGGTFGVIVAINCVTGFDKGGAMVFQANPLLCVLVVMTKGILAGLFSGFIYKVTGKRNQYIGMLSAAIVCPVVNTGIFLGCMALFFKDVLSLWAGGGDILAYMLSGIVLINFVPELIINVVFSPAGQTIVNAVRKSS